MIIIKSNLKQYQNTEGKFIAIARPGEDYWQTKKGQQYLREFYILEEARRCGLINTEECLFYQDQLSHPGEPCPWSKNYHEEEPSWYTDGPELAHVLNH